MSPAAPGVQVTWWQLLALQQLPQARLPAPHILCLGRCAGPVPASWLPAARLHSPHSWRARRASRWPLVAEGSQQPCSKTDRDSPPQSAGRWGQGSRERQTPAWAPSRWTGGWQHAETASQQGSPGWSHRQGREDRWGVSAASRFLVSQFSWPCERSPPKEADLALRILFY